MSRATNHDAALLDDLGAGWFMTLDALLTDLDLGAFDTPTRSQRLELAYASGLTLSDVSRAIRIRRAAARMEADQ